MILWPNKKQWDAWSLPSKLTAIGALVGFLSLSLYITEKSFDLFERFSGEDLKPEVSIGLQFPYERIGEVVKQNKRNPKLTITNRGTVAISPIVVDVSMFVLDQTLRKINSAAFLKYNTHGHLIFESELKPGKSVNASLAGFKNWTYPVAYEVRIKTILPNQKKIPPISLLFLIEEGLIKGEGSNLKKDKANTIRNTIQGFNVNLQKKVILNAPIDGVWVPHAGPGVDMRLNKDGTLTIK